MLKIAWSLSRNDLVAQETIFAIYQLIGKGAAVNLGEKWMDKAPSPEIAAMTGSILTEMGNMEKAKEHLAQGRDLGDDPNGGLELLEFIIASKSDIDLSAYHVAKKFESRRDLNPQTSKNIFNELLWCEITNRNFAKAFYYANKLLSVADDGPAYVAMSALAERDGQTAIAEHYLQKANILQKDHKLYYLSLSSAAIGQPNDAAKFLHELENCNMSMAERLRPYIEKLSKEVAV